MGVKGLIVKQMVSSFSVVVCFCGYRRRVCSKFYHDREDADKPRLQEMQPLKGKLPVTVFFLCGVGNFHIVTAKTLFCHPSFPFLFPTTLLTFPTPQPFSKHILQRHSELKSLQLTCSAPQFLAKTLHLTSDTEACRRVWSGSTSTLFVPATRRSSLGDRAFPVAAARLWNTPPVSLRTVSSYLTFRRELKTFLFNISFPDNCVTL